MSNFKNRHSFEEANVILDEKVNENLTKFCPLINNVCSGDSCVCWAKGQVREYSSYPPGKEKEYWVQGGECCNSMFFGE